MSEGGPIRRFLAADHARLDALLARAAADPLHIDEGAYAEFRRGLLKHIGIEEKIVLPAARRLRGGVPHELARLLREDHGKLAALLVNRPTLEVIQRVRALLGPHNVIEERDGGVYDSCDALAGAEADGLVEQMRAAPEVPVAPYFEPRTRREND